MKQEITTDKYSVHESSYIDKDVQIGEGTKIWHFCHILPHSTLGQNCRVGQNVVIGPHVSIGNNVKIQNNVSIYSGVILEDHVFCGPSMVFTNVINPRCEFPRNSEEFFLKTIVRQGASIGANATIVCGHEIGKYAFIGAGSVVTKNVPDYGLVYGNPASLKGWVCECGEKLNFVDQNAHCLVCLKEYKKINDVKVVKV